MKKRARKLPKGIVLPGEVIGVIEEFIPKENIYIENGTLRALVLGIPFYNLREHEVTIKPLKSNKPLIPRKDDIVYSQVSYMRENIAFTSIFEIENKGILQVPFTGILHVAQISSYYVRDTYDAIRIGDIIRARVISNRGPPFLISTKGRDMGVIYALCPQCMLPLKKRGLYLLCPSCRNVSKRKISSLYLLR